MRKKGISPLIATVLLIAFTMAIFIIIANWGTGFVNMINNPTTEKGQKLVQCSFPLNVKKSDVAYNFSGSASSVNVSFFNSGSESLYNFSFIVMTDRGVYTFKPLNQYNETSSLAKTTGTFFRAVNSSDGSPSGAEIFNTLRITALCKKEPIWYDVNMA